MNRGSCNNPRQVCPGRTFQSRGALKSAPVRSFAPQVHHGCWGWAPTKFECLARRYKGGVGFRLRYGCYLSFFFEEKEEKKVTEGKASKRVAEMAKDNTR